jgi:DNA-binding winged helix-turn-helix (wHTH) protein
VQGTNRRQTLFRFDAFVLDEERRQLLRGAREVHVSPKAFDLLICLIRERPRALSKADIHERLWPGTFVTDASLGMLVAEVRSALGDSARRPRFVRTVHRFGYAFEAGVTEVPFRPAAATPDAVYLLVAPDRSIRIAPGENVVGRDPQSAIWLDSPGISRRHARITLEGDGATVEDLGSRNGTRVRGRQITRAVRLEDGDEIRFGSTAVKFRVWRSSASTAAEE